MSLSPGQRLGPYEVVDLVGAGGMGEVYRARDTRLNRDVALKILPPQMAGSAQAFARFEREAQAVAALYPDARSHDGRWLLVGTPRPSGGFAILAMAADGRGDLEAISDDGFASDEASFSPDGRLVSYHNNRTGRAEVYLSRFPSTGERWQVSSDGGVQPRWSDDGRWLYYLDLTGRLTRVAVPAANPERIGRPEALVDLGIGGPSLVFEQYAVHGDRFLVLRPAKDSAPATVAVLSNWLNGLPAPAATAAG